MPLSFIHSFIHSGAGLRHSLTHSHAHAASRYQQPRKAGSSFQRPAPAVQAPVARSATRHRQRDRARERRAASGTSAASVWLSYLLCGLWRTGADESQIPRLLLRDESRDRERARGQSVRDRGAAPADIRASGHRAQTAQRSEDTRVTARRKSERAATVRARPVRSLSETDRQTHLSLLPTPRDGRRSSTRASCTPAGGPASARAGAPCSSSRPPCTRSSAAASPRCGRRRST